MMRVHVSINGQVVHTVEIVNRGPVGQYEDGDGPGGAGVRRYDWNAGLHTGTVTHARGDGPARLAAAVLADLAAAGDR